MKWDKIAWVAGGIFAGTAGRKVLTSKDAKRVYAQLTAAALRVKESVMTTATALRENVDDIVADAREINEARWEEVVVEAEVTEEVAAACDEEATENGAEAAAVEEA